MQDLRLDTNESNPLMIIYFYVISLNRITPKSMNTHNCSISIKTYLGFKDIVWLLHVGRKLYLRLEVNKDLMYGYYIIAWKKKGLDQVLQSLEIK